MLTISVLQDLALEFTVYHALVVSVVISLIVVVGTLSKKSPLKFISYSVFLFSLVYIAAYILIFRDTSEMAQAARSESEYRGQITAGSKFGITIGDNIDTVTTKLKKYNIRYNEIDTKEQSHPNECHGYTYKDIDQIRIYVDYSWRRGVLCVVVKDNRVVALSWFFQLGSP